jgi:ubiquinone/menaquinone biosynthesis C-methylase UbiE
MLSSTFAWLCRNATMKKLLWRGLYQLLAMRNPGFDWQFMNYGYLPDPDEPAPKGLTPADEFNRLQIGLYHHLLQSASPRGKSILEVGCGRGGGLSYIHRYHQPDETVGVDFSAKVIQLCRRKYTGQNIRFEQGDAEALPFENNRFDCIINVESSHCYPSMEKFLAEAARVLKPSGHFLCTDFRDATQLPLLHQQITASNLKQLSFRDITPRVLAAMDADTATKLAHIRRGIPAPFRSSFSEFAGVTGSKIYNAFKLGETRYLSFTLQKQSS